ncbi:MAG: hypothetical protein KA174_10925 [Chitinophagales bacterium]|jgi:hypothetical protein|nr:hypothetical protein [Saprospirales bacterium]MBP6661187.1 hypothetical protein [Chitinophagales bacterium]HUM52845.1 hypothetical protein [Chitinophagales bacterium]
MKTIKIITLIAIVILAISCKKENVNNNTVDNPNITHRILNKEIIAKADLTTEFSLIDIDNNGVDDFAVELYLQKFSENVRLLGIPSGNASLATTASSEDPYIIQNLAAKSKINTTSKDWSQLSFLSIYKNLPSIPLVDVGYAGKGDVLVGVQFLIDGNTHFGWLIINISSSRKYIIVKEVAYDIRPNVEILAAEK